MREITFQKALENYETVYMPARNLPVSTRFEYTNDLEAFIGFLEKSHIYKVGELQQAVKGSSQNVWDSDIITILL